MNTRRCEDLLAQILQETHRGHARYSEARDLADQAVDLVVGYNQTYASAGASPLATARLELTSIESQLQDILAAVQDEDRDEDNEQAAESK